MTVSASSTGAGYDLSKLPLIADLANQTQLSISLISRVFSGNRFPSAYSAEKLAKALGVTIPEFFQLRERVIAAGGMMKIHPVTVTPHEEVGDGG